MRDFHRKAADMRHYTIRAIFAASLALVAAACDKCGDPPKFNAPSLNSCGAHSERSQTLFSKAQ
jgi:hypothetical protein